ncbi:MAG: hypothetical protein R3F48_07150 [Candidatus Zixiibacteriota bacterium]
MRPKILIERLVLGGLVFACLNISLGLAACPPVSATGALHVVAHVIAPTGITAVMEENDGTRRSCAELILPADIQQAPTKNYYLIRSATIDDIVVSFTQTDDNQTLLSPDRVFTCDDAIITGPGDETLLIKCADIDSFPVDAKSVTLTIIRCDN